MPFDGGMVWLGTVEERQQCTGVDDEVGHALPFPEAGQQLVRPAGDRLTAREQSTSRARSGRAHHLPDGLADHLGFGHALPSCGAPDGGLQLLCEVQGRLLHERMVPPVAEVSRAGSERLSALGPRFHGR